MNTNEKGAIGLIKVIADLYTQGFQCFLPFDDYSPVDLIALDSLGNSYKLQIKYRSSNCELRTRSIINGVATEIDKSLIDGWGIYLSEKDKVIYIPIAFMTDKKSHKVNPDFNYGNIW